MRVYRIERDREGKSVRVFSRDCDLAEAVGRLKSLMITAGEIREATGVDVSKALLGKADSLTEREWDAISKAPSAVCRMRRYRWADDFGNRWDDGLTAYIVKKGAGKRLLYLSESPRYGTVFECFSGRSIGFSEPMGALRRMDSIKGRTETFIIYRKDYNDQPDND